QKSAKIVIWEPRRASTKPSRQLLPHSLSCKLTAMSNRRIEDDFPFLIRPGVPMAREPRTGRKLGQRPLTSLNGFPLAGNLESPRTRDLRHDECANCVCRTLLTPVGSELR